MATEKTHAQQLQEIELEMKQLELIDLRNRVQVIKDKAAKAAVTHQTVEDALADFRRSRDAKQEACSHRKGGKGYEGLCGNGQDSMYAIARHQMPNGEVKVICLRCQKIWGRTDSDYNAAMRFPTDNEMSASCLFSITKN
jgi:hypothetical protein